jgi:hypothetical protein
MSDEVKYRPLTMKALSIATLVLLLGCRSAHKEETFTITEHRQRTAIARSYMSFAKAPAALPETDGQL